MAKKYLNWLYWSLSFLLPIVILLIAFHKKEIVPYGDNTLLNMDLWSQYFPMFVDYTSQLKSGLLNGLSWNGALGFNAIAQSAYYTNSPFNLAFLFSNPSNRLLILHWIIIVKFGFAGLSFFTYLKLRNPKEAFNAPMALALATAYSLSNYMLAFISQPMWLDSVILLPLIILGLERLLTSGKIGLYIVTLALAIYTNFYIAYSICLFIFLYALTYIVLKLRPAHPKDWIKPIAHFAGCSLLSLGIASVVFIPVVLAITKTAASSSPIVLRPDFYHTTLEIFRNLLPLAPYSHEYGVANIFSGSLVLLALPHFFLSQEVPKLEKWLKGALLVFLLLSLNFQPFDFIWHGFRLPNQLPGRWSFELIFLLLLTTYEMVPRWPHLSKGHSLITFAFIALLSTSFSLLPERLQPSLKVLIGWSIYLIALYSVLEAYRSANRQWLKGVFAASFVVLLIGELGYNSYQLIQTDLKTTLQSEYTQGDAPMALALEALKAEQKPLERVEMATPYTFNPGQLYQYPGITYYSSTMLGSLFEQFKHLGMPIYADRVSAIYKPEYPLFNALYGIKYLITRPDQPIPYGFESHLKTPDYSILKNPDSQTLGYLAPSNALTYSSAGTLNAVLAYNRMSEMLLEEKVDLYQALSFSNIIATNATYEDDKPWDAQYYQRISPDAPVSFTFEGTTASAGNYSFAHNFRAGTLTLKVGKGPETQLPLNEAVQSLGRLEANVPLVFSLHVDQVEIGLFGLQLYALNEPVYQQLIDRIKDTQVTITDFEGSKFSAQIEAPNHGLFVTSLAEDGGWRLELDGKPVPTMAFDQALVCFPMTKGTHTLVFRYRPPGLALGMSISSICILLTLCLHLLKRKGLRLWPIR